MSTRGPTSVCGARWKAVRRPARGVAGPVFLFILLGSLIVAAYSYMGRQSSGAGGAAASIDAAIILKQADDLRTGFERMQLERHLQAAEITFDDEAAHGLFSTAPDARFAINVRARASMVDQAAQAAPPFFIYNTQVRLPQVGSVLPDDVAVLPDLNKAVCQQVNMALYGDAGTPPPSSATRADWLAGAVDDRAQSGRYAGRAEGCVATLGGRYLYYKAMAEN